MKCREISDRMRPAVIVGMVIASLLLASTPSPAANSLVLGWSARSGELTPLWITYEGGFFEKQGLETRLSFIEGGSLSVAALMGGSAQMVFAAGPETTLAHSQNPDVIMIASLFNGLAYQLLVSPDIKTPQDLKGKKLAIAKFGSLSDLATRLAVKDLGLDPEKDVAYIQVGSTPSRAASLKADAVQGTLVTPPVNLLLEKLGFRMLYDMIQSKTPFQSTGAITLRSYVEKNPSVSLKVVRALAEGIHLYKTNAEFSKKVMQKYLRVTDAKALSEAYRYFSRSVHEKPYVSTKGLKFIISALSKTNPKVRGIKPASIADNQFVRQLDKDGFLDSLYRGSR